MNTIRPISLSRLSTSELLDSGKKLIAISKALAATHPHMARQVSGLTTAVTTLSEIDTISLKSDHTAEIQDLDHDVDGLLPVFEGDLHSNIRKIDLFPGKGKASQVLLACWEKRDREKLIYGSYQDQGRELDALFADIYVPELEEVRTQSGTAELLDIIKEKYGKLSILRNERHKEESLNSTVKEQKVIIRYRMDKLLACIDASILDNVEGFAEIQAPVNDIITEVMSLFRARMTRKEKIQDA